ncbi:hypothetical protein SCA6_013788 [Theobroma cacao]
MTQDFSAKLGEGGFGSVFYGTLPNGAKIAVKRPDGPEEEMHLLNLFRKKAEEGKLLDLVDKMSEDMQPNEAEVVKMMRIAAWCLQVDYTRRPCMTDVLRVLEDFMDVKPNLIYDFLNPQAPAAPCSRAGTMSIALPSILSGPR